MSQIPYSVVIVDCLNLLHRNWWPRRELKTSKGVHSGMEYGFLSGLLTIVRKYPGATVLLAWDGQPTRCREIFPEYKLHRQPIKERGLEADWGPRIEILRSLLLQIFCTIYHPDTEADEEIARLTWYQDSLGIKTLVFSNDKDIHQLVTMFVHVCPFEKDNDGNDLIYDYPRIQSKWGFAPERIPLYRSLLGAGDTSDGIRGIPRFPSKLALKIVNQCEGIDQVLELMRTGLENSLTAGQREKLRDSVNQELVMRNYRLMELLTQRDLMPSFVPGLTGSLDEIRKFCHQLEFRSLIDRPEWKFVVPGASHAPGYVPTGRSPGSGEV